MVFGECYALPIFVEESSGILEENMVKGATSMWRDKIYHEDFSPDLNLNIPFKGMNQLTDLLYSMEGDVKQTLDRFKKLSISDKERVRAVYPYTYWRNAREISKLTLKPLDRVLRDVEEICGKICDNPSESVSILNKATSEYKDGLKLRNLKASVATTDVPYYMSPKDMLDYKRESKITTEPDTFDYAFIPFLMEFYNIRLKSNVSDKYTESSFKTISKMIESKFKGAISRSQLLHESVLAALPTKEATSQVELFFYTVNMLILQLSQYVIALYMRTLSAYVSNMRNIMKIVSVLDSNAGDVSDAITESVVDIMDTCTLMDPTDIVKASESLIIGLRNTNIVTNENIAETNGGINVDDKTYKFPIVTLNVLDGRLKKLILLCRDDEESALVDMLTDVELSESDLSELFANTERAENVNFLKSTDFHPGYIYRDLSCLNQYAPLISEGLNEMSGRIIPAYIRALETNVNNSFKNGDRNAETVEFLKDLSEKVGSYARSLGKAYTKRLKFIGDKFNSGNPADIEFEPEMYFGDAIASSYKVITEYSEAVEDVNRKYRDLYISTAIGMNFFEDDNNDEKKDDNNNNGNGSNDNKAQNNNGGDQNKSDNNNDKKDQTKPTVEDGGAGNNNSNDNKDQNNGNNNDNSDNKKGKSIVDRLIGFINKTIDNLTEFFEKKGAKKKNKGFCSLHEKFLKARNYVNTKINMLPYLKDTDYAKKAETVLNNIANIDDETLKTADEQTLMNRVFGKFKLPSGDEPLDVKITQSFKIGSAKPVTVTIENNAIKAEIPGMLDFVTDYYDNFIGKMEKMKDSVNKLKALDDKSGSGENDRTNANKALLATWANAAINGARNAARDRVNDIMLVLSALAKGDPSNKSDNNDNGNNEKKEDNTENSDDESKKNS